MTWDYSNCSDRIKNIISFFVSPKPWPSPPPLLSILFHAKFPRDDTCRKDTRYRWTVMIIKMWFYAILYWYTLSLFSLLACQIVDRRIRIQKTFKLTFSSVWFINTLSFRSICAHVILWMCTFIKSIELFFINWIVSHITSVADPDPPGSGSTSFARIRLHFKNVDPWIRVGKQKPTEIV